MRRSPLQRAGWVLFYPLLVKWVVVMGGVGACLAATTGSHERQSGLIQPLQAMVRDHQEGARRDGSIITGTAFAPLPRSGLF